MVEATTTGLELIGVGGAVIEIGVGTVGVTGVPGLVVTVAIGVGGGPAVGTVGAVDVDVVTEGGGGAFTTDEAVGRGPEGVTIVLGAEMDGVGGAAEEGVGAVGFGLLSPLTLGRLAL